MNYKLEFNKVTYEIPLDELTLRDLVLMVSVDVDSDKDDSLAYVTGDDIGIVHANYWRAWQTFSALSKQFNIHFSGRSPSAIDKGLIVSFGDYSKKFSALIKDVEGASVAGFKVLLKSKSLYVDVLPYYDEGKIDIGVDRVVVDIKGNRYDLPIASDTIGNRKKFEERYYNVLRSYKHLDSDNVLLDGVRGYVRAVCMLSALIDDFVVLFGKKDVMDIELKQLKDILPVYSLYNAYYTKYTDAFLKDIYKDEQEELGKTQKVLEKHVKEEGIKQAQHAAAKRKLSEMGANKGGM